MPPPLKRLCAVAPTMLEAEALPRVTTSSSEIGSEIMSSSAAAAVGLDEGSLPLTRFFCACLENRLMMSADLPFSSVLGFLPGRERDLSGLALGDLVLAAFCRAGLTGGLRGGACD